jgi:hypothetical protein
VDCIDLVHPHRLLAHFGRQFGDGYGTDIDDPFGLFGFEVESRVHRVTPS